METEKEKDKRRFVSLPVSQEEYQALVALVVAETASKKAPVTKAELMREALNMKSEEVTGKRIFQVA